MRKSGVAESFWHESKTCPPSPLLVRKLRIGMKADITGCLEKFVSHRSDNYLTIPCTDVFVIDNAAAVNLLKSRTSATYDQYRATEVAAHRMSQLNSSTALTSQQLNSSTSQQLNSSTTQQLNISTAQQLNISTAQQLNNSTAQHLNSSTA